MEYAVHLIQKNYGWTDRQIKRIPFARFYCAYKCCVFEEIKHNREARWSGAFITWQLANMFSGSKEAQIDWVTWGSNLGILPPKKVLTKEVKEAKIKKSYNAFENVRDKFIHMNFTSVRPDSKTKVVPIQ